MTKHKSGVPRAQRGETLAEVLVALLIVTLATLLLASMVTASGSINLTARQKDEKFYEALSKVEAMDSGVVVMKDPPDALDPKEFDVIIKEEDPAGGTVPVKVHVYTSENLAMYKEAEP